MDLDRIKTAKNYFKIIDGEVYWAKSRESSRGRKSVAAEGERVIFKGAKKVCTVASMSFTKTYILKILNGVEVKYKKSGRSAEPDPNKNWSAIFTKKCVVPENGVWDFTKTMTDLGFELIYK